jgi:hypothetical protein
MTSSAALVGRKNLVERGKRHKSRAALEARIAPVLINVCRDPLDETRDLGFGGSDMDAVIQAIEQRTAALA